MTCTTTEACQSCQQLKELAEFKEKYQNLQEKYDIQTEKLSIITKQKDDLTRKLIRYENPHTPPSRRLYATHNGDHTKSAKRYPGRPKGHTGATRPKPKVPDAVIEPPKKTACSRCGAPLRETSVRHRIIEEIPPRQPRQVIDYLQFQYQCTGCSAHEVASHPDCPPDGIFGVNALCQVSLLKFDLRLPYDKVAEQMEQQFGLPMTASSALEVTQRVSQHLTPEYETVVSQVRAAPVINVDETSVKVDGKNYWIWVFVAAACTLLVIRKSRGKNVLEQMLGKEFAGFIGCDGWSSYPNFTDRLQRCWAHLLREAEAVAKAHAEAELLYLGLKGLYWDVQHALELASPWMRLGIKEEAEKRLGALLLQSKDFRSKEARGLVGKVRRGFNYWFTFVVVEGLEATNNRAENALREAVVQRKIFGTLRNERGTKCYGTMMTLIATWKQQKLNLHDTMKQKLTRAWASNPS